MQKPLMLMILDGYGLTRDNEKSAIYYAKTPNLDKIFSENPITSIGASGYDVGLPDGQMGNSEVGHTNIGAGRVVYQDLAKISKSIEEGDFFENSELNAAIDNAVNNGTALHIMGLLSNGGVHSHIEHLYALVELANRKGVKDIYIHAFLDGRDVSPTSGAGFVRSCATKIRAKAKIATVMGRYYAMDRDNRFDRVKRAYDAMVLGRGTFCRDPELAVKNSYDNGKTDEFVEPVVCVKDAQIKENDSVIFFNFRPDRAREITRSLVDPDFVGFERENGYFPVKFVCMTQYDATLPNVSVAFKPEVLTNTLGEYLSKKGKTQLRIAETEKYAHVTFFFNGGEETVFDGEDRDLIDSPADVATYDLKPEMSAYKVKDKVIDRINNKDYDVIVLNFANCDMVGHTGIFEAAVKAVEAVDTCVGEIYTLMKERKAVLIITADHGNAELMKDIGDKPFTAHTTNRVPFCVVNYDCKLKGDGKLCDIAPTILEILGLPKPQEMTGTSLIEGGKEVLEEQPTVAEENVKEAVVEEVKVEEA
ncbi:MAG: 2,3-bisphosphoglycerate-independent phosphoglycerate mutase, partial [Clostridia bacterium]|nr:2,3-bisphosphoglycerate-independent phosphoglycerate mutase [Clostridia bacterium]